MKCDIAVVGGGIAGLTTALQLARDQFNVVLLDRQETGRACSWAGGGILTPLRPWKQNPANLRLCQWSAQHYPAFCQDLFSATGIDPEYEKSGMLFLDCDDTTEIKNWIDTHAERCEWIPAGETIDLAHNWFPRSTASLWVPGIAQARNPRLLKAIKHQLNRLSVRIVEQRAVKPLTSVNGTGSIQLQTDNGTIECDRVVIAAGVWSNDLLPEPYKLELVPIRGQMLSMSDHAVSLHHMVINQECYLIPRRTDVMLIGSTVEDVGFDAGITKSARTRLLHAAYRLLPGLQDQGTVRQWSGLRPKSVTGSPYIGAVDKGGKILVNTGHYRTGLLTSLASARLVADLVSGKQSEFQVEDYFPVTRRNSMENNQLNEVQAG